MFIFLVVLIVFDEGMLWVILIGGFGEIGWNMIMFEYDGKILIVDCGVFFFEEYQFGVDLILFDFEFICDWFDDIVGVVLMYGYEDYIGVVFYLLCLKSDIFFIGLGFMFVLVEVKFKEYCIKVFIFIVKEGQQEKVGLFDLEFVVVNYLILDVFVVVICMFVGMVFVIGDFKMDQLLLDGWIIDLCVFLWFGEEGVDFFFVDLINVDVFGFIFIECLIGLVFDQVIGKVFCCVIVVSFFSYVYCVQQVIDVVVVYGCCVVFFGCSMVCNMMIVEQLGYLKVLDGVFIDFKKVCDFFDEQIVYMLIGLQGELMVVFSCMVNMDYVIEVSEGDIVIFVFSFIFGNENVVYCVIDGFIKFGVNVVYKVNVWVYVLGYVVVGELLYCYNILKLKNVFFVYGEYCYLIVNVKFVQDMGIFEDNMIIVLNGIVIDLKDGVVKVVGQFDFGFVYVDGLIVGEIIDVDFKDCWIFGEEGFIFVIVVVDVVMGCIIFGFEIYVCGVVEDDLVFDDVMLKIVVVFKEVFGNGVCDMYVLLQIVCWIIGCWVNQCLCCCFMIVLFVIEV